MSTSFNLQNNHGIMDDDQDGSDSDSISSSSYSNDSIDSSDLAEDDGSSPLSSSSSSSSNNGPLFEMSSIMQQLPIKRGLSKHFQGKSQSFTSLSNVTCLEDLAKPANPCNKRMKSCRSYGGLLAESHKISSPKTCSRVITKNKGSRGSCPSLSAKRSNSFLGNRPPVAPQRPSTLCNQTPLFA